MQPITRQEQLLNSIATGDSVKLEPITREEQYLSAIAGLTDLIPEKPITRKEMFYEKILESGGSGGAKEEQEKTVEITKNGITEVVADEGKAMSKVTVNTNVVDSDLNLSYTLNADGSYVSINPEKDHLSLDGSSNINTMVYVSDKVLTSEDLIGLSVECRDIRNGSTTIETINITADMIMEIGDSLAVLADDGTMFLLSIDEGLAGATVEGLVLPSYVGTYLLHCKDPMGYKAFVSVKKELGKPYIDTSKITNFTHFCRANRMNDFIKNIDTSNGKVFDYMFQACTDLSAIPQLNTSKGQTFDSMFVGCSSLKTIPLLDTSQGLAFNNTFYNCGALETLSLTTAKSNLLSNTFQNCTALKNITIGEGWAVNIYLHYSNNLTVESLHGMIENLADLTGLTAKTFQIGATNLAKIDEEHINMLQAKNWNYS